MAEIISILESGDPSMGKIYHFWEEIGLPGRVWYHFCRFYNAYKPLYVCKDSNKEIARKTFVSEKTLIKYKRILAQPNELLGGNALISIQKRYDEDGTRLPDLIVFADQDRLAALHETITMKTTQPINKIGSKDDNH